MPANRKRTIVLGLMLMMVFAKSSNATSSTEYAAMGRSTWSAFQCSGLAAESENPKEQERLFKYGYAQGLKFINAIQTNKTKGDDSSKGPPLMMLLLLQGPTPDFMLGRVYETALDWALKDVYNTGELLNSAEMQKSVAKAKFWEQNCQLIGQ